MPLLSLDSRCCSSPKRASFDRQPRKHLSQPRRREVDKFPNLGHRYPATWGQQVDGNRWMFGSREDDLQLAASDCVRYVVGVKARKAAPPDGRRMSRSDCVYCYSRTKAHNARYPGACGWSETPRID